MKKILPIVGFLFPVFSGLSQNVGIGTSAPNSSAKLEVSSTNSGLLIPRVSLVDVSNGTTPISAPANSLLVYNTNAAVTGGSGTGYYYWDGSVWVKLNSGAQDYWSLTGNAGIIDGTNFIGTLNNAPFVIKVNNQKAGRIENSGATFLGYMAGNVNTSLLNVGIGNGALQNNTLGWQNTAVGYQSMFTNTTGNNNVAVGHLSLSANQTGTNNSAAGNSALQRNTLGSGNSAFGNIAMTFNTTGNNNSAMGIEALRENVISSNNTAMGYQALRLTTAGNNVGFGSGAGSSNATGTNNTFIGANTNPTINSLTNASAIGAGATVSASNAMVLGNNANVGIGVSTPDASSKLDVTSTNTGVLIPRIALTSTAVAAPVTTPTTSLLVYNSATAGVAPNNVTPGYYYWNGAAWVRFQTQIGGLATDWTTLGNSGTVAGTNFIGTTDAIDFVTKTNNTERIRVTSGGNVGIGTTVPGYRLDLANGTFAFGNSNVRSETRNNAGLQGNAGAQSGFFETDSPVNYPAGATSWWHLIDVRHSNSANNYALQISGSFFDQELWFRKTNSSATTAWTRLLSTGNLNTYAWSLLGNSGTNASTNFIGTTDGVDFVTRTTNTERMRVTAAGNVGIGTTVPGESFSVFKAQGGWQSRFSNTSGTGADVYLAHGGGYGMHIRGWNSNDAVYTLEMYNNTARTNVFYNSGRVGLGLINFVGVGTETPGYKLDVNGTIRAMDIYAAGGQNLIVGDDTYFSDLDVAHRLGLISASDANIGELKLGNSATNPVLSGNAGFLSIDQEVRIQNPANRFSRATRPVLVSDLFDSGTSGVFISNSENEEGVFWANGNYAMIMSPGDNDLVKFVDEDGLDNAGSAFDGGALRARIDGAGQYFQVSDKNSKQNIVRLNNGLSKIMAINGYSYDFNQFPDEITKGQKPIHSVGIIAQEVENVLPEAVSNTDGQYMVNYNAFVPLFIEAIKEQQTLIEEQRKLIEGMRKELDILKEKE